MSEEALFMPGTGTPPPHLAGRGVEQSEFATVLRILYQDRKISYEENEAGGGGRQPFVLSPCPGTT